MFHKKSCFRIPRKKSENCEKKSELKDVKSGFRGNGAELWDINLELQKEKKILSHNSDFFRNVSLNLTIMCSNEKKNLNCEKPNPNREIKSLNLIFFPWRKLAYIVSTIRNNPKLINMARKQYSATPLRCAHDSTTNQVLYNPIMMPFCLF